MNQYKVVTGVARVGAGQVLYLSGPQIKARARNLELPDGYQLHAKDPRKEKPPVPQPAAVKAKTVLEFKAGEIIGLPDLPTNLIGIVEPLDEPKSGNDQKAADLASAKRPKAVTAKPAGKK